MASAFSTSAAWRECPYLQRKLLSRTSTKSVKAYLRLATAIAGLLGTVVLLAQYFLLLPIFALLAKRAARRERPGFSEPLRRDGPVALRSQY